MKVRELMQELIKYEPDDEVQILVLTTNDEGSAELCTPVYVSRVNWDRDVGWNGALQIVTEITEDLEIKEEE